MNAGEKLMTITLNLEPGVEAYLREKAVREGQATEAVAQALLAWAMEREAQDQAETLEGVRRGLEASDAGRVRPAADVFADMRAKLAAAGR
jgi:predicted transcriptional regulator